MSIDFKQNHFQLFGLPACFELDLIALEQAYRKVQSEVHPDRFAHLGDSEKRLSLQWATQANEAYQTLRNPLARARYLLHLAGVDTQEETNTAMPVDFLMAQMEWREAIMEAKASQDADSLEDLSRRLRHEVKALHQQLHTMLDEAHAFADASTIVRKLRFMEKLDEEIGDAIDATLS
ncbi:molecular chaperone HscB [Chitinivorax tropicus]|uniref:Co-chaperone protein HscB homolog n=1 Tax=Chitinivorax tropicus TaxID=714531 RepID=A0A840MLV5_9PROT|nr:Fe-S protein assembly co-chaperone HscB [Chitinivorax tropicus]MBB5017516.1 molecular chaperone HscB [Chitinivorax tropicus]